MTCFIPVLFYFPNWIALEALEPNPPGGLLPEHLVVLINYFKWPIPTLPLFSPPPPPPPINLFNPTPCVAFYTSVKNNNNQVLF